MKNTKIIYGSVVGLAVCGSLAVYIFAQTKTNTFEDNNLKQTPDDQSSHQQTVVQSPASKLVLSITPQRCTGCGKCVLIDPVHFQMSGSHSTVVSQENLNSVKIKQAQAVCKFSAINLL